MKQVKSIKGVLALPAVLALWGGVALAGGDYDAGARKSIYCAYCHGYDGNPVDASVPQLAGRQADYIVARIKALSDGRTMHQAMLQAYITGNLGEKDIADLAAFYARQTAKNLQR